MEPVPYQRADDEHPQATYHVIPDTIRGGWNVYVTNQPQGQQRHFQEKEQAVDYAEQMSLQEGVGFIVEESEAPIGPSSS